MAAMIDLLGDDGSDTSDPWQPRRSFMRDDSRNRGMMAATAVAAKEKP
jgi:hypothetical protein